MHKYIFTWRSNEIHSQSSLLSSFTVCLMFLILRKTVLYSVQNRDLYSTVVRLVAGGDSDFVLYSGQRVHAAGLVYTKTESETRWDTIPTNTNHMTGESIRKKSATKTRSSTQRRRHQASPLRTGPSPLRLARLRLSQIDLPS